MVLHSELTVGDDVLFKKALVVDDTLQVRQATTLDGTLAVDGETSLAAGLTVKGCAHFHQPLQIHHNLQVEKDFQCEGEASFDKAVKVNANFTVGGPATQAVFKVPTQIRDGLQVEQQAHFGGEVTCSRRLVAEQALIVGKPATEQQSKLHITAEQQQDALAIDQYCVKAPNSSNTASIQRALTLNATGHLGLGCVDPKAMLDVRGDVHFAQDLCVAGHTQLKGELSVENGLRVSGGIEVDDTLTIDGHTHISQTLQAKRVELAETFQLGSGPLIQSVSCDPELGGHQASDTSLVTQKAGERLCR